MRGQFQVPTLVPRLSRGAHRSPRQGACFMEFASFLAGERWSDHPECTDPVLSTLARAINDGMSDERRDDLASEIPRVIGLRGDDSVVGLIVALRAATVALPVASMDRQRALAVGIRTMRLALAEHDALPLELDRAAESALAAVPDASAWAHDQLAIRRTRRETRRLHHTSAPAIARIAATGVAEACVSDTDVRLIDLLRTAIDDVETTLRDGVSEPTKTPSHALG